MNINDRTDKEHQLDKIQKDLLCFVCVSKPAFVCDPVKCPHKEHKERLGLLEIFPCLK